jgi:hypothetical protein
MESKKHPADKSVNGIPLSEERLPKCSEKSSQIEEIDEGIPVADVDGAEAHASSVQDSTSSDSKIFIADAVEKVESTNGNTAIETSMDKEPGKDADAAPTLFQLSPQSPGRFSTEPPRRYKTATPPPVDRLIFSTTEINLATHMEKDLRDLTHRTAREVEDMALAKSIPVEYFEKPLYDLQPSYPFEEFLADATSADATSASEADAKNGSPSPSKATREYKVFTDHKNDSASGTFTQYGGAVSNERTSRQRIKQLFQIAQDRIDRWNDNYEKETLLVADVPCWLECGAILRFDVLSHHILEECPHRPVECFDCRTMFRHKDFRHHQAHLCLKRKMACPNAAAGCYVITTFDRLDHHLHMMCQLRIMECRRGCGKELPVKRLESHELTHCKLRVISCDQCGKSMIAQDLGDHLHHHCQFRKVLCTVGCGAYMREMDRIEHETTVCRIECKYQCGEVIGPTAKRQAHEIYSCIHR